MRGAKDDVEIASHSLYYIGLKSSDLVAGKARRSRQTKSEPRENLPIVLARRRHKPRSSGVRIFVRFHSRKLVGQPFGDHEKVACLFEPPALLIRKKLIYRIERLELYSRARIQLGKRDNLVHPTYCLFRACIAIGIARIDFPVSVH